MVTIRDEQGQAENGWLRMARGSSSPALRRLWPLAHTGGQGLGRGSTSHTQGPLGGQCKKGLWLVK